MHFCRSWFSNMVSFRYVLVFLNFLHDIFSIKFYTISFLWDLFTISFTIFLLMRNITRWMLDTEIKVFHISWNDPETVFHEMTWKKNFTVYPSLKTPFTFWDMRMWDIWKVCSQTFRICEKLANFTCKYLEKF